MEPRWGHLIDYTYDGVRQRGQLSGGLGQLVDGVKGPDNFSFNNGFEWVGWKSMNGDVVVEFSFKTVRNFTGALFHSNNLFSSGVEVFQAVDVHYGIDLPLSMEALRDSMFEQRRRDALLRGQAPPAQTTNQQQANREDGQQTLWSPDVLSIEYEPDKRVENSRPVTVHLKQRLANRLRFQLKFASKWILVSEVEFLSHPVELLSLASISSLHTPQLLGALTPAKTYDEFVAILREHQLRRIATSAYLESFGAVNSNNSSTPGGQQDPSDQAPDSTSPISASANFGQQAESRYPQLSVYDDYLAVASGRAEQASMAGKRVTGPAIPVASNPSSVWQTSSSSATIDASSAPSTNPMLNQLAVPFSPMQPPFQPQGELMNQVNLANRGGLSLGPANDLQLANESKRTLGFASVILFALVATLLLLGLLFALSKHRFRQRHKLAAQLNRHLPGQAKGLMGPSLNGFMSVFSAASQQHAGQQTGGHDNQQYNAIFASSTNHLRQQQEATNRAAGTLRRLAGLANSQRQTGALASLGHQQQQQQPGQLLVSVKEPSGQLFGGCQGATKSQVSTQLILGLNQANPLAQQQIYNNSSNLNCSNQTYATHYSTSMSMASSSTTGHQGDYADYAIPDAQAMIPAASYQPTPMGGQRAHQQQSLAGANLQHQQLVGANFGKAQLGYQTELRASHRFGHHLGGLQHQTSLVQPLLSAASNRLPSEHNYELIHQEQRPSETTNHTRTLSGQLLAACQGQPPPPPVQGFNSATLSNGRLAHLERQPHPHSQLQHQHQHQQHPKQLRPVGLTEECSPGGSSQQSGATTATTSANSSGVGELSGSHYYYSGSELAGQK